MAYRVELLAHSANPNAQVLSTFLVEMPRSILAETNTHRVLSRNAASSRAIPTKVMIRRILHDPYVPEWTARSAGMSGKPMSEEESEAKSARWLAARDSAIASVMTCMTDREYTAADVRKMYSQEIAAVLDEAKGAPHKQDINRILEPWLCMEWVVSATDWDNFFFQRVHPAAHPAFQKVAYEMARLRLTSKPQRLDWGQWHLPLVTPEDYQTVEKTTAFPNASFFDYGGGDIDGKKGWVCQSVWEVLSLVSAARCGRVSYAKQSDAGDVSADLEWFNKHIYQNAAAGQPQHVSPAEHPAMACTGRHGNFAGWHQLRKSIPGENYAGYGLSQLNRYEKEKGWPLTCLTPE